MLNPADTGYPVQDGDHVFHLAAAARKAEDRAVFDPEYLLSFELRFEDETSAAGSSPLSDVEALVQHANAVALALRGFVERAPAAPPAPRRPRQGGVPTIVAAVTATSPGPATDASSPG